MVDANHCEEVATTMEPRHRTGWAIRAWRSAWPPVVLALLCLAFFWDVPSLPADRIVLGDDATNQFVHWLHFAVSSIRQGQFPLWNPYLYSGLPLVANPQPALFYPPTWMALLMPVTRALSMAVVLHLWLAGVGMYAWLRSEDASTAGALFGAAVFAFSGYFLVRVRGGHVGVVTSGAWLPWVMWGYRRALARRSWGLAVVGGLPVGLVILAGHEVSLIYVALGLVTYAAFYAWSGWRAERSARATLLPLAWAGVMMLIGLAVGAAQLLPSAEMMLHSTRQATSYDFASLFSWPPGYLLTLLVPNFFGEPTHTGYWGDGIYDEFIYYVGILPLLLALLGLRLRHRLTPFLSTLGLGVLLLAFGQHGVLHRLLYQFVPPLQIARAPARAGFLFTLAVGGLAGLTVTALQTSPREERTRLLGPLKWPTVLAVAGGALALIVAGFVAFALGRETNPAVGRLWHQANQTTLFLFFLLLSAGLLTAWRNAPADHAPARSGLWLLALGLVVLDLWTFGNSIIQVRDVQQSAYWRIVAQAIPDPQAARVLPWGLNQEEQNGGIPFGIRSIFGYDPLTLQRYEEFITSRPDPRARTYDLLNGGYLVTTSPQEYAPEDPDSPRLLVEESSVYVYERPNALPQAWVVPHTEVADDASMLARIHDPAFDPRTTALVDSPLACEGAAEGEPGQVEILRDGGNRIEAQVQGGGGLLVFSEVDYPGWRATVDGNPARLVRADYLLRALCVPAGEHQVVLVYSPPLPKIGLAITGLTLLSIVGIAVWTSRRRGGDA